VKPFVSLVVFLIALAFAGLVVGALARCCFQGPIRWEPA
jgi:archaellum component FlaG (FlaF/FlaG flagellin family)